MPTGNAPGHLGSLNLVEQHEASAGVQVAETIGTTTYSDGDAGRELTARVPERPAPWEHHGHATRIQVVIPPSECSSR